MKIAFVSYGLFNSNSGGHILNFANNLTLQGHAVAVFGDGDPADAADFGKPACTVLPRAALLADPAAALAFDGAAADPANTILHGWTPREIVRTCVERVLEDLPLPYVVHLEDNEEIITTSQLGRDFADLDAMSTSKLDDLVPPALSHPHRYKHFLAGAAGVTGIVDRLFEFAPDAQKKHVLAPGVDSEEFAPDLDRRDRRELLHEIGAPEGAKALVYHGNMHAANRREMFSLYTAVMLLRRRGHNIILLRAGQDFCPGYDVSYDTLKKEVSIDLGFLKRSTLIQVLKLADFFVQPGAPDEFNIYRMPSKLPEFLALGRPVVLPRANLGLELRDGEEALLLTKGDATDIADRCELFLKDAALAERLGEGGRAFARSRLNWAKNAEHLASFYERVLGS